jgi:hypothetical protein
MRNLEPTLTLIALVSGEVLTAVDMCCMLEQDRCVKVVLSHAPSTDGWETLNRLLRSDAIDGVNKAFQEGMEEVPYVSWYA